MSEIILSWTIFCLVFTMLLGLGVGVMSMTPPEFAFAKWCFSISAFVAAARLGWWLAIEQTLATDSLKVALVTFILFGCIGILWVGSLRWVDNRQHAFFSSTVQGKVEQEQLRVKTLSVKKQLRIKEYSNFITQGQAILSSCKPPHVPPSTSHLIAQHEQWAAEVKTYFHNSFNTDYVNRFLNSRSEVVVYHDIAASFPDGLKETYEVFSYEVEFLRKLLKETREGTD